MTNARKTKTHVPKADVLTPEITELIDAMVRSALTDPVFFAAAFRRLSDADIVRTLEMALGDASGLSDRAAAEYQDGIRHVQNQMLADRDALIKTVKSKAVRRVPDEMTKAVRQMWKDFPPPRFFARDRLHRLWNDKRALFKYWVCKPEEKVLTKELEKRLLRLYKSAERIPKPKRN